MPRRAAPALVLSLAVHVAVVLVSLSGGRERAREPQAAARSFAPVLLAKIAERRHAAELREARAALVSAARAQRSDGHLDLGAFLLEASRIDADERGIELDITVARARYEERKGALRAALATHDLAAAAPLVFGDLKYYGRPGGLMASALTEGGGSCEQISQLVAAAAHDVGPSDDIALRYYGGIMADGASHITPIALEGTAEHDLMSGLPAAPGGIRIAPAELIEIYARAHALAPPLPTPPSSARPSPSQLTTSSARVSASASASASGASPAAPAALTPPATDSAPPRPTLVAGLPFNDDRYPGALPLYAARAVHDPTTEPVVLGGDAAERDQLAHNCAYLLRTAVLSPPSIEIETPASFTHPAGLLSVEPRRVPTPARLERESMVLRAAETLASDDATDPIDRLMAWACLAALGDAASVDFSLAREHALAAESVRVHRRGREEGKKALAAIDWSGEQGTRAARKISMDYGGGTWLLLALEGGDRVVLDLTLHDRRDSWGRINALSALVVSPSTRVQVIVAVSSLPLPDQVDVMHEVFHTHDHMRPWAASFDLDDTPRDDPAVTRFLTGYRVFRALAWRLWEGQRPVGEILAALAREARAAGTDPAWEATLLEYLARNALGLYSQRAGGHDVVRVLREAADASPQPSLAPLRRQLAYLEAQARLDNRTLADAWRVK